MLNLYTKHALISIKPQYATRILDGTKTIEIRKGAVCLDQGTKLWIYSTLPVGAIIACADVSNLIINHPNTIWSQYKSEIGVTYDDYKSYLNCARKASAIFLTNVQPLHSSLSLSKLRDIFDYFQPPQSYQWINTKSPMMDALNASV